MPRIPRLHKKWPVAMSIVTLLAAFLLVYRWDIYRGVLAVYRTHVLHITEPKVRNMAEQERIQFILEAHKAHLFGIDISHYQRTIDWDRFAFIGDSIPISFVIFRASMGTAKPDKQFKRNWASAKHKKLVRGAYHYYRPDENSIKQAENFIKRVKLSTGDLPPILDIEALPNEQSLANLKIGLKRWLTHVETHYKVKPIIYTGDHFYATHLNEEPFNTYPIWIANYSRHQEPSLNDWHIWQFSESGIVKGVGTHVDLNVLNGNQEALNALLIAPKPTE